MSLQSGGTGEHRRGCVDRRAGLAPFYPAQQRCGHQRRDQGDQDEQGDLNDQGTSDEQESDDCKDDASDQGTTTPPTPSADREKACMEAAGMSTDSTAGGSSAQVKTTGLDHAIETVLANCIKNPQAPGLLNALHHLMANRDRHAAHDADKAARKAAHEAAKASKGHGHGSSD